MVVGLAVVALIVVAAGAVMFLGTSQPASVTADRRTVSSRGDAGVQEPVVPRSPTEELGTAALTSILDAAEPVTGPSWTAVEDADVGPTQPQAPCSPPGMGDGKVAGRGRTWGYRVVGGAASGTLSVSAYEYRTVALMQADLDRVRSSAYEDCRLARIPEDYPAGVTLTEPTVQRLDAPLGLNAVGYRTTVRSSANGAEMDNTTDLYSIGLGRLRVVVETSRCCYTWDGSGRRTVVASVVQAAGEVQSLPVPDEVVAAAAGTHLSEGPDPCAVLTVEDFAGVGLASTGGSGTLTHGPEDGEATCTWTVEDGQVARVITTVGGYEYDPPRSEPVLGVGDSAAWIADEAALVVRTGGRVFIVELAGTDLDRARTKVLALAQAALDRQSEPV